MPRISALLVLLVVLSVMVAGGVYYLGRQTTQPTPSPTPPLPATAKECKVTGCSSQVCAEAQNEEEIVTDCEWKAEYACYKQVCNSPGCKTARCERQRSGECGWTQDEALVRCLKEASENAMPLGIE